MRRIALGKKYKPLSPEEKQKLREGIKKLFLSKKRALAEEKSAAIKLKELFEFGGEKYIGTGRELEAEDQIVLRNLQQKLLERKFTKKDEQTLNKIYEKYFLDWKK